MRENKIESCQNNKNLEHNPTQSPDRGHIDMHCEILIITNIKQLKYKENKEIHT